MTTASPKDPSAADVLPLEPSRWEADQAHSGLSFSVRHLGLTRVRGRFERFEAAIIVGSSLSETVIEASVDMTSVNTNNADRDAHLLSTDFFNVDAHPTIDFRSTAIAGAGQDWVLNGDLTINGITRALELPVTFTGLAPFGDVPHAGFEAAGELRRSDFGIEFGLLPGPAGVIVISDVVKFDLDLQFVRTDVPGG